MIRARRIERAQPNSIKAFRDLLVADALFRPELARGGADRVGLHVLEATFAAEPGLELGLLLEHANIELIAERKALRLEDRAQTFLGFFGGPALAALGALRGGIDVRARQTKGEGGQEGGGAKAR